MNCSFGKLKLRVCKCAVISAYQMKSSSIDYQALFVGVEVIARDMGMLNSPFHRKLNRMVARFARFDRVHWFGLAIFSLAYLYLWLTLIEIGSQISKAAITLASQDRYANGQPLSFIKLHRLILFANRNLAGI
jgi:hypothetical protein